jgi:redox-sensing transcriptional repressor
VTADKASRAGGRSSADGRDEDRIPAGVIERLPLYLNVLIQLRQDGAGTVSSARLGEMTDVTLIDRVQKILGSDHTHRIVLVGAGNLGSAIANYNGLRKHGFIVSAVFDTAPARVGTRLGDLVVRDASELERVVEEQGVRIGVLAVPPEVAQAAADRLAAAGIRVILNYTPVVVRVPAGVTLHNTDPVQELLHTLYYLSKRESIAPEG